MEIDETEILENKIILEEYLLWNKNIPYLYDDLVIQTLEHNSPSVVWNQDELIILGKIYNQQNQSLNSNIMMLNLSNEDNDINGVSITSNIQLPTTSPINSIKAYKDYLILTGAKELLIIDLKTKSILPKPYFSKIDSSYSAFDKFQENQKIALGFQNGYIKYLDMTNGEVISLNSFHRGAVNDLKFHCKSEDILFSAGDNRIVNM